MRMRPAVTDSRPASMRRTVDLPEPEPPTSTSSWPSATSGWKSSTTLTSPKRFVTCSNEMAGMAVLSLDAGGGHALDEVALEERVGDDDRDDEHHRRGERDAERAGAAAEREDGEELRERHQLLLAH